MYVTVTTAKQTVAHSGIKEIVKACYGNIDFVVLVYESGYSKKLYRSDTILEMFFSNEKKLIP